jgi:hypothetical protein
VLEVAVTATVVVVEALAMKMTVVKIILGATDSVVMTVVRMVVAVAVIIPVAVVILIFTLQSHLVPSTALAQAYA